MRPINLLPPYIYDKQKKAQLAALWGLIVLAVAAGFIYHLTQLNQQLQVALDEKAEAERFKQQYDSLNSQIQQENQAIANIKQKQDFIANAQKYNDAWHEVYTMMRDVTSPRIILRSMAVDPQSRLTVVFNGAARTEMDIVRWWMALRNDTERFQSVRMELPPHPYVPGGNAAGTASMAGMARGGFGPGGMGAPGSGGPGSFGSTPMIGGLSGPGGGGFSGGPGGAGRPMIGGLSGPGGGGSFGGGTSIPSAGGMMPGAFGGGQQRGTGQDILEGKPVINFTGVVVLKEPLAGGMAPPSWPPAAAGGAGMGMGGATMPGMGMGGMGAGGLGSGFSGGPGGAGSPMMGSPSGAAGGSLRGGARDIDAEDR